MTQQTKTHDIHKLPKWAQVELDRRERKISELEQENEAVRDIADRVASKALEPAWRDKGAYLDPYRHNIPIGDGHVRYVFDDFQYADIRLDQHIPCLSVHASRGISVQPVASNSLKLMPERW